MNAEEVNDSSLDDVVILAPEGLLLNRKMLIPFYQRLSMCEQMRQKRVVVDLSQVQGFGAALVGWLVTARQRLKKTGGEVVLVGLSDRGVRTLRVSKLSRFFKHFPTVEQAVAGFGRHNFYKAA